MAGEVLQDHAVALRGVVASLGQGAGEGYIAAVNSASDPVRRIHADDPVPRRQTEPEEVRAYEREGAAMEREMRGQEFRAMGIASLRRGQMLKASADTRPDCHTRPSICAFSNSIPAPFRSSARNAL